VHKTRLGPIRSMRQNSTNAVMHVGHSNGTVTMWTPNVKTPVVKLLCHPGHVTGMAVKGNNMLTAGADGYWKIWDLRKYEQVHSWRTFGHPVVDMDISDTGLVALGFGPRVEIWRDVLGPARPSKPYLTELHPGRLVESVRFRPYEDVCGVGHSAGFASMIVPGAGMANFDTLADNPFETKRQRREKEVHSLLEKLQPDSIMLDASRIGSLDRAKVKEYMDDSKRRQEEEALKAKKEKKKMRGKQKVGNRMKRKQLKQGKWQRVQTEARLQEEAEGGGRDSDGDGGEEGSDGAAGGGATGPGRGAGAAEDLGVVPGAALRRFAGKRRRRT